MGDFDDFDEDFGDDFGSSGFGKSAPPQEALVAPDALPSTQEGERELVGRSESVDSGSGKSGSETEDQQNWPYVRHRGLFTVPVTPENAYMCGWLLEEVAAGMWRKRWCMLQGPRGYLSLHDSDASDAEATVVIPTSLCRVKKVKAKVKAEVAQTAVEGAQIPEGHPPEKPAPAEAEPAAELQAEPEPEPETGAEQGPAPEPERLVDKLPAGLKQQAAVLDKKYGVSTQLGALGKVAEAKLSELEKKHSITAKLGELEKKHHITDQINAVKTKVETSAAELDHKHGISDMLEIAKAKAREAAEYLEGDPDGEHSDSHSESGSELGAWGGDDPSKHKWAFRIEIKNSNLPMVVGARASVFTLDPSTESGQTAWLDAILGTAEAGVAGTSAEDASTTVDEAAPWLPANRQSRAPAQPKDKPLINLDLSRERIESYAAKKAAKSVAKRLTKTRTSALDELVSAGKSGSKLSTNVESGGVMSKLKGGAKDLKETSSSITAKGMDESAISSAKSSSKSGTSSSNASSNSGTSSSTSGATDSASSTAEGASEAKGGGGVRDAAILGALVGGASKATSALHDSRTQAAELCRVADVVSSMSMGHLHRLVSDKTGRSVMQETHEDAVRAALAACEIDVEGINYTTRLAIGKAAVFGAASGGVPAAAAAAASKQAMMRGLGSKSAGAAGTIALAAFDIGKDATKVYHKEMDKEEFKKKAGGHVTTSAAGAAGAVQGASMGSVAGPAGSFVGAVLGGIGASIAASKGYEAAIAEKPEADQGEEGERSAAEIAAAKVAAKNAKRTEIAAEFRDSEQVEMAETANGEPLKTLLRFMSTDELWRYLSDRSLFTRMGDTVLHANELREAAMELLRPDGCLCLDEHEITAFPRAQLCRLLLDAGTCSREALSKLSDDELRVKVFDAYGSDPRYMDATGSSFAGKISPGGTAVAVQQVATAGPDLCKPVPPNGISAPIRWLGQGEELQDCIAICPRTPSLSFPQMLKNLSVHRPAAIVIVDSGRGSEGELTRMVQASVPIPCVSISAETAAEIRAIIETSSAADVRTMVRAGPVLYVSKTRVARPEDAGEGTKEAPPAEAQETDPAPDPDVDAVPDPDAEPEPAMEAEQELPYEWVKFAQVASDKKLAFDAYSLQTPTSRQEEASEMANAAMVDVVQSTMSAKKSAERFLSKKLSKKAKGKEQEQEAKGTSSSATDTAAPVRSSTVEVLHPPPQFDVSSSIVVLSPTMKIGGAVPSQEDPAIAGCVVLLGPENIETDATPWHVLYCALKAGAIGVVWAAAPDSLLEALRAPVLDIPCVSISEETGKQLEQMVAKEAEADDMFAPIPTGGDGDAMTQPATLTAGLGLWINDSVRFESVAVGQDHCLALTNLGSVFSWGIATKGRLGLGQHVVDPQLHPTLVSGSLAGKPVTSVAAGHNFSYAVSEPGTLYSWGCNDSPGFLGVGDTIDRWEPCEVTALRDHPVSLLAVQHTTTVCVTNDGAKVFCWGTLEVCGKGVIRMAERTNPVEVEIPDGLVPGERICSAAAGRFHAVMASDQGRVWTWGRGRAGRLGLGKDKEQTKLKAHPTPIPAEHWSADPSGEDEKAGGDSPVAEGPPVVTQVYAQDDFTFATTAGGDAVWAWGCNDFPGKLGLGDTKDRFVPTRVKPAASEEGDDAPAMLPPVMYFSGKLAATLDGTVYHFSKDITPFAVVPPVMTAAQVSKPPICLVAAHGLRQELWWSTARFASKLIAPHSIDAACN